MTACMPQLLCFPSVDSLAFCAYDLLQHTFLKMSFEHTNIKQKLKNPTQTCIKTYKNKP